jgi:CubicO group peptidase (beta-lactamase class C family)
MIIFRNLVAAFAFVCIATPARAQTDLSTFEGVWTSRLDMGPEARGELSIKRTANEWRASIGEHEARSRDAALDFPDGVGRFHVRGDWGWWIQPPGLPGVSYATPVRLRHRWDGSLHGHVQPLAQTFTLHLALARGGDGSWFAAFRNPQFNMNGGASRFAAVVEGGRILVRDRAGETVRELDVVDGARLRVAWPPLPQPLELTRPGESPSGYLPRTSPNYAYASPPRLGDGWRTGRARAVGLDEAALSAFVQELAAADPASQRAALIHSVLVARRGRLVLEEYFHGYDRDTPHDLRSAGKMFASLLLGVAMRNGADIGPESRIYDLVGGARIDADPRRSSITLAHLMTHTSGLDCDDNNDDSPGNEGAMQGQSDQPDWWRFALDLPMAHVPGERYAYCTAGMNLVGAALHAATGESVIDLFDRNVAQAMDFGVYHWNLSPNGEGYLGGGVYMRPRDLAKIGQLYLDGGVWNGRRILDRSWVERSTAAQIEINEATTGMDAERFGAIATRGADGFAWHRYGVRVGDRRAESYEASGNGGQLLIVVPEFELVVVITGGNYGQGAIWTRWRDEIVGGRIIAALRE